MSADLDLTELEWSGGQSNAGRGGGGSTEVVLVEGAVVALLVIAFLVYATNASDDKEVAGQDRPDSNNAYDPYSAENEPGESGGTFETIDSSRSSV